MQAINEGRGSFHMVCQTPLHIDNAQERKERCRATDKGKCEGISPTRTITRSFIIHTVCVCMITQTASSGRMAELMGGDQGFIGFEVVSSDTNGTFSRVL